MPEFRARPYKRMETMTDVIALDVAGARRLTERLRLLAQSVADNVQKLRELVEEAKTSNVHETLGYASWTAYLQDVFGDEPLRLARDVRQELVAELSSQGMSTRAIAPIVGAGVMTVQDDLSRVRNRTPDVLVTDSATGEIVERVITGLDGKTYSTPTRVPQRRALTDQAQDAGFELRKAVERIMRVREDDRYTRNKRELAVILRGQLLYTIETCSALLDEINQSQEG